jgi:hypothetical protein
VFLALGQFDAACNALLESLDNAYHFKLMPEVIKAINCAATLAGEAGDSYHAALWFGFVENHPDLEPLEMASPGAKLGTLLDHEQSAQHRAEGKSLTFDQVVEDVIVIIPRLSAKATLRE